MLTALRRLRRRGRHCRPPLYRRTAAACTSLVWHTATKSAGRSQLATVMADQALVTATALAEIYPRTLPLPVYVRQPWQPRVAAPIAPTGSCWLPYTPPTRDQLDDLLATFNPSNEYEVIA